jgi:hypothetical protein
VAFYVPLGPRGLLIRIGTLVISIWGALVYRLTYRHRTIFLSDRVPLHCVGLAGGVSTPLEDTLSLPSTLVSQVIITESETKALV